MLRITPALKRKLKKPFGKLYPSGQMKQLKADLENRHVIAVGDSSILKLAKLGVQPHVSVYDLKTRREPIPRKDEKFLESIHAEKFSCVNPAGYITPSLVKAVLQCVHFSGTCKLFVIGEEDLATLVFLMHAKSGVVCYGQPGRGMVVAEVNGENREKASKLFKQFRKI